jgi:hypothetical protein
MPIHWEVDVFSRSDFDIYNPHGRPMCELPTIWGYNAGKCGSAMWHAQLVADDGARLGGHVCSSEGFMYGDLGILKGSRPDRHAEFRDHYPDGYKMDFVPHAEVPTHDRLQKALKVSIEG